MERNFDRTFETLKKGRDTGIYPGGAVATGDAGGELFRAFYGSRAYYPTDEPLFEDTLFDVASMTKIMSTTMIAFKLMESGKLSLTDKLGRYFQVPEDKKDITIWNLMTHTSGLPAHIDLWVRAEEPAKVPEVIAGLPLLYAPGKNVTYSCLGYIMLGKICENICGKGLDALSREMVFEPLGMRNTGYCPTGDNIASTEYSEDMKCYIKGVVHDENARFIGSVSGNAGIFSDIADCSVFARMLASKGVHEGREFINRDLFLESVKNHTPGMDEGRGLGFVVKSGLPSSAGNIFPDGSYGHTGFTGTSVWVDGETSQYAVFLTNRVHPTRENAGMIQFRKDMHDACAKDYRMTV